MVRRSGGAVLSGRICLVEADTAAQLLRLSRKRNLVVRILLDVIQAAMPNKFLYGFEERSISLSDLSGYLREYEADVDR